MIMCTLLSTVYGLFIPCWLTHVTCTHFKETALLFNEYLSCFVNFYRTDKYMFRVNNEKIRLICMCSTIKTGVFIVDFDHSQNIIIVPLLLTLNKHLSVGRERQVIMFWKHKKPYIRLFAKVARPISLSNLSLHRKEINYDHFISILLYGCEHIMDTCFSSKFALGIPIE